MFERFRNQTEQNDFKFPHLSNNEDFLKFLERTALEKAFPDYYKKLAQKLLAADKQNQTINEPDGHLITVKKLARIKHKNLADFETNCKNIGLPSLTNKELNEAAEIYEKITEIINHESEDYIFNPLQPNELVFVDDLTERQPDQTKLTDANGKSEINKNSRVRLSEKGRTVIDTNKILSETKNPDVNLRSTVIMITSDGRVIIKPDAELAILQEQLIVAPNLLIVEVS